MMFSVPTKKPKYRPNLAGGIKVSEAKRNTEIDSVNNELLDEMDDDDQREKYLTFQIGDEEYGVGISYVTEINGVQPITELPDVANFIKGVINLRGNIVPVIDVRTRFGMPERDYDDRTCIIRIHYNEISVGLIVDQVAEVLNIKDDHIQTPPKVTSSGGHQFIEGLGRVGDSVKILLDVDKLLYDRKDDD